MVDSLVMSSNKYPKSVKIVFIFYIVWFVVTILELTSTLTPFDGKDMGWIGLSISFDLYAASFVSFILGIVGLVIAYINRKVIERRKFYLFLSFTIIMLTVVLPVFFSFFVSKALKPISYKIFNQSYVEATKELEARNWERFDERQKENYEKMTKYLLEPRYVKSVYQGNLVIGGEGVVSGDIMVKLVPRSFVDYYSLTDEQKKIITKYANENYKGKSLRFVLPEFNQAYRLSSPVSFGEEGYSSPEGNVTTQASISASIYGVSNPYPTLK